MRRKIEFHDTKKRKGGIVAWLYDYKGSFYDFTFIFTDDCYLLFKIDNSEITIMKNIFTRYENILGKCINYNKSTVIFTMNTSAEKRREVCIKLGVQEI